MSTALPRPTLDATSDSRYPFGLPLGTVRGFLSLLICSFFWVVLLWPDAQPSKPLLGHYFMLALVLLTFSPYSKDALGGDAGSRFLPRLLRFLVVAGTVAVIVLTLAQFPDRLRRLTPDVAEFQAWWGPMLATTAGGFLAGMGLRRLLGGTNPIFYTLRAWLSVVGMLMLTLEVAMFVAISLPEATNTADFAHYWQAFELAIVAAYFGTRA